MKKIELVKKLTAVTLILMCLPTLTGCSEFLKNMAAKKVEAFFTEFADAFAENPTEAIMNYSEEEITFDEFHDEQIDLALTAFDGAVPVIEEIKLNEKRTKAEVEFTLEDVRLGELETNIGTFSELADEVHSFRAQDVSFTVTILRDDEEWFIEDLSEMKEVLFMPYLDNCILDEDGNPLFINEIYIQTIYVGSYWYDPISGNPANNLSMSSPVALQNVFYFNQPMFITFSAKLLRDGEEVSEIEVVLDGDVVATCDFDAALCANGRFSAGGYTVVLLYEGDTVAESDIMHVS